MRIVRLYTPQALEVDREVRLESGPAGHLVRVLRRQPGDEVVVFNGDGREFPATVLEARRPDHCRIRPASPRHPAVESLLTITLVQAVGRGERMDYSIQKAVELGVAAIVPVVTERTEVRLQGARADKRRRHWQQVAIAACEQSGRCRVPAVHGPRALFETGFDQAVRLLPDPGASQTLDRLALPADAGLALAIGPEGGFSQREESWLERNGFTRIRLGPRILRTETAGPAAITAVQALFGDWRGAS